MGVAWSRVPDGRQRVIKLPLVLAAAKAHEKSVALSQREPLRIRVDLLLPALSSLRGHVQAQERR